MAVAGLSSSSAEQASAISSRLFLVADVVVRHLAGSADALRQPNAAPMQKRTLWLHSRKPYMARRGPYRCGEPGRTRWSSIKSRFPGAFAKASGSVCVVRVKLVLVEEKAATFFFGCDWPSIRISQSKAAI